MQQIQSLCAALLSVGRSLDVCEEAARRRKPSVRRGEAGGFSAMARLENHRNVAATVACVSPPNVIISVKIFVFF